MRKRRVYSQDVAPPANVARLVYAQLAKSAEPMSSGEIKRATGANIKTIQSALTRFLVEGLVVKYGTADWNTRWGVSSRRRKDLPERRGKSPGSKQALKLYGGSDGVPMRYRNLTALKNVHVVNGVIPPKPKATTPLEQFWGWVPVPRETQGIDDAG